MGTYAWNTFYSNILFAKSCAVHMALPPRAPPVRPYTEIWLWALTWNFLILSNDLFCYRFVFFRYERFEVLVVFASTMLAIFGTVFIMKERWVVMRITESWTTRSREHIPYPYLSFFFFFFFVYPYITFRGREKVNSFFSLYPYITYRDRIKAIKLLFFSLPLHIGLGKKQALVLFSTPT